LPVHIAFLFSAIISHGCVPRDFSTSTIIPIPKKRNANATDSENYRGISLSSVFGKIFDNIVLCKYYDNLCTSELQFGFKANCSTNMCTMILKETIAYYTNNKSPVFCTFLDATKAFDRVNFCKLFRLLIKRNLPACIVRTLINMYTGNLIRVSWAGITSDYFSACNGVKQGGVMSPVLFCIYIDNLLISLSSSGFGCFIGSAFTGALAYADDIVLICPSPYAMRRLLGLCDSFASEFDMKFNASKSKFLVVVPKGLHSVYKHVECCLFSIGGQQLECVHSYCHLGHIITSKFDDTDDIFDRRIHFIGQVNSLFCFFNKMDLLVKIRLFKSYCSSLYGCELWSLFSDSIDNFCSAYRTALRRLLSLPFNAHSFLLPFLTDSLPIMFEICKRSVRFILACLGSQSHLVQFVARHGILFCKYRSIVGSNLLFCCKLFKWSLDDCVSGLIDLSFDYFSRFYMENLSESELSSIFTLVELISLREGYFIFDNFNFSFSRTDVKLFIDYFSTL
jgi:hypothetical protein